MIITPASLKALMTGFKKNYQDGLQIADSQYRDIATVVPSSTASNTYGWLGQWPGFREWVGDRVFNDMQAHAYSIANKHYESSIKVGRNDIEDDNIGIYAPLFTEMGRAAAVHPDELVFGLLKNAHNTLCYDGQNFFDTDHPVAEKVDGTGNSTTVSNVYSGAGAAWYLLDTSRALKPFIFQERKAMNFTAMTRDDDESVFMRNEFRYGVDGRHNVGLGFWQMAAKSTEELNAANFAKVYTGMVSQKADGGRPLAIRPTLLVVPPTLEDAARQILEAERTAAGQSNIHKGKAKVLVSPWLL
ncbi:phage major head subunit gpT-like protein [Neisseria sp. HSC-16F19]|nr:Mu-like prophage major head subunit gpT family protein [Neisseria sp. HSC-16F19]MCP2041774.1 phage major head subunit gpT-like protein [Neisseria sp. HSC-16F19]